MDRGLEIRTSNAARYQFISRRPDTIAQQVLASVNRTDDYRFAVASHHCDECRQPAPGTGDCTTERNGGPAFNRRKPQPADTSANYRESPSRSCGRCLRTPPCPTD